MVSMIRPPVDGSDRPEPTDLLDIELVHDHGTTTVTARGEIDLYTAPLLESALNKAIESGVDIVVIDLSEVTFMASSGLTALLGGLDRARRLRCELRLAGGGRAVQRPLIAAGLDGHFEHFASAAEARQLPASRAQGQEGSVAGHTVSSRSSQPAG